MLFGEFKIFRKKAIDTVFFNRKNPLSWLLNSCAEAQLIFDVGANVGQSAKELKTLFPNSTLHCFEPIPGPFRHLDDACRSLDNSFAHQLALSDQVGSREFYVNTKYSPSSGFIKINNNSLSVIRNVHPKDGFNEAESVFDKIIVRTTTLDDFVSRNIKTTSRVNLLKIDTQGAECQVLAGAEKLLSRGLIDVILTEISLDQIFESNPSFGQIESFLGPRGYSLWDISHIYKDLKIGRTCWVDAIYVHESVVQRITSTQLR